MAREIESWDACACLKVCNESEKLMKEIGAWDKCHITTMHNLRVLGHTSGDITPAMRKHANRAEGGHVGAFAASVALDFLLGQKRIRDRGRGSIGDSTIAIAREIEKLEKVRIWEEVRRAEET